MNNSQHQVQTQKQGLNAFLLQQKLQVLHLMHLPALALEEYLKNQLEENPALEEGDSNEREEELFSNEDQEASENKLNEIADFFEEDDIPEYKTYVNNSGKDETSYTFNAVYHQSFQEQLKDQLKEYVLDTVQKHLIEYLIDSLDEDGQLHTSLSDLSNDYSFAHGRLIEEEQMEAALKILQGFDPPGIGARSVQECLLIQLSRLKCEDAPHVNAGRIVSSGFSELYHKNYDRIKKNLDITDEQLKEALKVIGHLRPKPVFVALKDLSVAQTIVPEFLVVVNENDLEVSLTNNPASSIRINNEYAEIVKNQTGKIKRKTEFNYFRKKVDEARWLLEALQQREHTLLQIMKIIAGLQKEFFLTGERKTLRPMILEDVAKRTGYDISTVSRVTCNKYVQTAFGNILLKDIFSTALHSTDGEAVSSEKVKQTIVEIVEKENKSKPYTDFELVQQLKEKGFEIARRTVVKYREHLHLPNARMRKTLL